VRVGRGLENIVDYVMALKLEEQSCRGVESFFT
jgi:hypothetical protein